MKNFHSVLFAIPVAVLGCGTLAQAATITYGPTLFNNGGTLTSVELSVTGNSAGGTNGLHNLSNSAGSASVSIGSLINVSGPSSLVVLTDPIQTVSGPVIAYTSNNPIDFSGPDAVFVSGTSSTDTQSATLSSGFAPYVGLGNVTFNFTSSVDSTTSASVAPAVTSSTPPTFNFTPTVTYTYDAIPEPSTLGLLGVGVIGLAGARRKRVI